MPDLKPRRTWYRDGEVMYPNLHIKMRPTYDLWNVLREVDTMLRTQPEGNVAAAEFVARAWHSDDDYDRFRSIVKQYVTVT